MSLNQLFLKLKGGDGSGNWGHSGGSGGKGNPGGSSGGSSAGGGVLPGIELIVRKDVPANIADRTSNLANQAIKDLKKYKLFQRQAIESRNIITDEPEPDFNRLVIDRNASGGWDANSGTVSIGFPAYMKVNQIQGDLKVLDPTNSSSNWAEGIKEKDIRVHVPTVIRHEMGHYAQDRLLTKDENAKWRDIYTKNKDGLHRTFRDDYYSGKQSEAFAESLALVTHKGYQKNTLPAEVEDFITGLL